LFFNLVYMGGGAGGPPSLQTVYNKNKDQEGKFLYYSV